jgi:hypothetical protein
VKKLDSVELELYRNRKINPNQPSKVKKWLTPKRKNALTRMYIEYPYNCRYGHLLCPISEHYEYTEHKYYTFAIERDVHIRDSEEKLRFDATGKPITVKVFEIHNADNINVSHRQLHDVLIDNAVKCWSDDSRIDTLEKWRRDRRELHKLNEKSFPLRGRFNNISSVIFHESQPLYYLESIGMNGLTMQPYAKVKLASSRQYLFVELGNSLLNVSKNRRHKILKYGKTPKDSELELIDTKVKLAVRAYLGY